MGSGDDEDAPEWERLIAAMSDPTFLEEAENGMLSHDHYSAIGLIAARWAYYEAVIDTWLLHYAEIEADVGICFTSQMMGSRPKIEAFIALSKLRGAPDKWNKRLEELAKETQSLSEQRNRAVHDVWDLTDAKIPLRHEATAKRLVRNVKIHVPTEKLLGLARAIDGLRERFEEIASDILMSIPSRLVTEIDSAAPSPSPDTSRPDKGL
jgi:hypothetical protein